MRYLYRNDLIRLAKDVRKVKSWFVYFLLYGDDIIFVGVTTNVSKSMSEYDGKFDRYYSLSFGTLNEATENRNHYLKLVGIPKENEKPKANELKITKQKVNVPDGAFVKKDEVIYLKVDGDVLEMLEDGYWKGVEYRMVNKSFGKIEDLLENGLTKK